MDKYFLTDIDGVVFNFHKTFEAWARHMNFKTVYPSLINEGKYLHIEDFLGLSFIETENLILQFFQSDYAKHFITYKDSYDGIRYFKGKGYTFIAITAIGDDSIATGNRQIALDNAFGVDAFADVIGTDPFGSKLDVLKQFEPTIWIDDTPEHVIAGLEANHFSIRLHREIDNRLFDTELYADAFIAPDWHAIVEKLS